MAARRGDDQAWATLYGRYSRLLVSIARSCGLNAHDAEDVAQETWLRFMEHIHKLRSPAAVGAWLATTARRETLRVSVSRRREVLLGDQVVPEQASPRGVDDELIGDATRAALGHAIGALTPTQCALLSLMAEDSTGGYQEISDTLGIPVGSIGPTRARALERLRGDAGLIQLLCD